MDLSKRTSNTVKNSVIGLIAQLLQVISSFVCRMIFVRVLTESYLGVNGLFGNILSILSLGELGIGSAITFELYSALAHKDDEETKSLMQFYRKAYTYIGIGIGIIGLIIMPFISRLVSLDGGIHENIYLLYSLYLANTVISYFFSYKASIIEAAQQNYVLSLIHTAVTITQNIVQCIVLLVYRNFVIYLAIQIICGIAYNVFVAGVADRMFPILKEKDIKPLAKEKVDRMFKNVKDIFITSVAGRLVNSTDNIIITAFGGLASTGLNSNYALLYATLITFTTKVQLGIKASVGNVNAIDSKEKRLQLFDEIHFTFFWMYFWCACCFIMLVQDVIGIFFGKNYVMSFSIAVITGLNFYVAEEGTVVDIFKTTMGLFSKGKYSSVATGIINIILSILLGKYYGVEGILLATFISRMLTTRWYFPYVTFKHGFHASPWIYYRNDVRYWIEGVLVFLATYYLSSLLSLGILGNLLYRGILCIIVPNALLFLIHRNDPEFERLKSRILGILKKKKA